MQNETIYTFLTILKALVFVSGFIGILYFTAIGLLKDKTKLKKAVWILVATFIISLILTSIDFAIARS